MGKCFVFIVTVFVTLTAVLVGIYLNQFFNYVPPKPVMDLDKWWGEGSNPEGKQDHSIRPFKIEIDDRIITDLKQRLKMRRPFTKPLEGIQSEYGTNTIYLEGILNYWQEKYDFKKRMEQLNQLPHYKTRIQGLDLHFIRVKPESKKDTKILPLLMLHGWPSSSKEFSKIIPTLTSQKEGYDFVFEVVAVDLPGFGFSEATNKPGLTPAHMAVMVRNLMRRLGFFKFYIQGGDWGSQCGTHLATLFPEDVLGFHTNMPLSSLPKSTVKLILGALWPSWLVEPKYQYRIYPLKDLLHYILLEGGYFHIQATKPDTIGVALMDSPSGLASYIVEKMAICANRSQLDTPHGGLENLDLDDVLDTITITWVNNCIVTSMRIYAEAVAWTFPEINILHRIPTPVPTAAINFEYEVLYQPDSLLRDKFPNLVRSTTLDFGGHFAALQTPEVFVDDIFASAAEFLSFHRNASKQNST